MKALGLALIGSALMGSMAYVATASGAANDACMVVSPLAQAETAAPRVAAAIDKNRRLNVAVAGTTSSMAPSPAAAGTAYPARLEAALASRLPGITVKVTNEAKPRQTAATMAADFKRILLDDKPDLVIWQTGTFDAIHGVDPEEYRSALEKGILQLHAGHADVILVNMQYSPRTESMIAASNYADQMRWVALQQEVPLFDRLAIMKEWSDLGTFDLYATTKDAVLAERVHDCLGRLLADFTLEAAKLAASPPEETR